MAPGFRLSCAHPRTTGKAGRSTLHCVLYRLGGFSPSLSLIKLKISLCGPCLVCKVSVFTHRFVKLLEKRRRDHEAKKAAAAPATVAEGKGQQTSSSTTPSVGDRAGAYVRTLLHTCNVMGYGLSMNTCS